MAFESKYTGYTGSHTAMRVSEAKISCMLAESDFAPSLTNTSSGCTSAPRGAKSCRTMASRRKP